MEDTVAVTGGYIRMKPDAQVEDILAVDDVGKAQRLDGYLKFHFGRRIISVSKNGIHFLIPCLESAEGPLLKKLHVISRSHSTGLIVLCWQFCAK